MKYQLLRELEGGREFGLVFEYGDEVMEGLGRFAQEQRLKASSFTAIGAFENVVLGWFDWETKHYKKIPVPEQVEALSLLGDVTLDGDTRKVHAHAVVGTSDGMTRGGHLLQARVRPTLEVFLSETGSELRRVFDPLARISLIKVS